MKGRRRLAPVLRHEQPLHFSNIGAMGQGSGFHVRKRTPSGRKQLKRPVSDSSPNDTHLPTRMRLHRSTPGAVVLLSISLSATFLPGCGCEEERPYTPFQVATSLPKDGPPAEASEEIVEELLPRVIHETLDRPDRWSAFGRELVAPKGSGFVAGIEVRSPAGEAAPGSRVAAWTFPRKGHELGGNAGLWLFDADGSPVKRLARVPAHLPTGRECSHSIEILDTGARSFSTRLTARCDSRLLPGTATGALLIVDPDADQPERFTFRISDSAPGEELRLTPETKDEDGDGLEDLSLTVGLKAPSGVEESLVFRWVGRPSGLSHVAGTPQDSLRKRAARLAIAAVRRKEREHGLAEIDALRRLLSSSCAESKTEKITDGSGAGLECGSLTQLSESLSASAITAHLGMDAPYQALGEYERSDSYFGPATEKVRAAWASKISAALDPTSVSIAEQATLPLGIDLPYPIATPLRFDEKGERLYSLSADGRVKRIFGDAEQPPPPAPPTALDPPGPQPLDDELGRFLERQFSPGKQLSPPRPETPGLKPWPLRPSGANGEMLAAAVPSCERSEVQLAFTGTKSGAVPSRPLPFLAPRPGGCRSLMAKPLRAEVISWQGARVLAIVEGQPVVSAGHFSTPATPLAWGTSLGIAVWTKKERTLLTGPETTNAHHCVTTLDAKQVACVRGSNIVLFRRTP